MRSDKAPDLLPFDKAPDINKALDISTETKNKTLSCLDLGSGAGLPGLVLAYFCANSDHFNTSDAFNTSSAVKATDIMDWQWTLCDRSQKRADFLKWAAKYLNLKVLIVHKSVEDLHNRYDCITARAFASPPVVAECSANLLKKEGIAVISDFSASNLSKSSKSMPVKHISQTARLQPAGVADAKAAAKDDFANDIVAGAEKISAQDTPKSKSKNKRWNVEILMQLGLDIKFIEDNPSFVVLKKIAQSKHLRRPWKKMQTKPLW